MKSKIVVYYRIKSIDNREFRCYYQPNQFSWLPYFTPTTMAAFELPSNEMEERTEVALLLNVLLNDIEFTWN